jgi:hypothetical protein
VWGNHCAYSTVAPVARKNSGNCRTYMGMCQHACMFQATTTPTACLAHRLASQLGIIHCWQASDNASMPCDHPYCCCASLPVTHDARGFTLVCLTPHGCHGTVTEYVLTCDLQKHIHSELAADPAAVAYAVPEWRQQPGWTCQSQQDPPAAALGPAPKASVYQQPVKFNHISVSVAYSS